MKKLIAITFSLFTVISTASAQNWCGSMEHRDELNSERPEVAKEIERKFNAFNKLQQENEASGVKNSDNYVIPVVFHIIHKGGNENISFAQIEDQMRSLNEDFAYLNEDSELTPDPFKAYAGDAKIEFRLAQLDPEGNCTQGVTRTFSQLTSTANNNVKELIQWDPYKYFNVWVVKDIDKETSYGTILGYAQFPDELWSNAATDGVILRDDYCGSIGTASSQVGRTLTHEAGHWLNLRHIWGDATCGTDYVNDTPAAEEPNFGICLNDYPYRISVIGGDSINSGCTPDATTQIISQLNGEMFMNYMDYSDDNCMNMFSLLQGDRMRSAIDEFRSVLVSETNLIATGTNDDYISSVCTPTPEFTADYIYGCPGDAYSFFNETYNVDYSLDSLVTYEWTFEGGTPASSIEENPEDIIFLEAGFFTITLSSTNSAGERSLLKEAYITVTDDEANMSFPYIQNFESTEFPTFPTESWNWLISSQIDPTWNRTTEAASPTITGIDEGVNNAALRIRSASFTREGDRHTLITPTIDLSNATAPINAYYDIAYARKNIGTNDNLRVYISDDCGRTWVSKKNYDTESLITNDGFNVFLPFVPIEDEWERFQVSLSTLAGEKNVQIKFELIGENGNWLYLDNFIVSNSNEVSLSEIIFGDLVIYPNPSQGDVTIEFELYKKATIKIALSNVYGATLASEVLNLDATKNSVQLNSLYHNLKAGIYFIQLEQNGTTITKKVVISD
tara:strand:+ start:1632 stop:3833 length:2202 start_codon:yes stop_codon:yes gene_type:complete